MHDIKFKVAVLKNSWDGQPTPVETDIPAMLKMVQNPIKNPVKYSDYQHWKAEAKAAAKKVVELQAAGDTDGVKAMQAKQKDFKYKVDEAKSALALMPFAFKDDVTFKMGPNKHGKIVPKRDNKNASAFTVVMLDIEANISREEIATAFEGYEYMLWPTISYREDDPRFRVMMFLEKQLPIPVAQALMLRLDAQLPARNSLDSQTQAIDVASIGNGRLMYAPNWLKNHPVEYFYDYNEGQLLNADSFPLTAEQQAVIDQRDALGKEEKQKRLVESAREYTGNYNPTGIIVVNGKPYLDPEFPLETELGYIRVKDIDRKISGVRCPTHTDGTASEFVDINDKTGRPQVICKHPQCGVIHMWVDPDAPATLKLVKKPKSNKPKAKVETVKVKKPKGGTTLEFDERPLIELNDQYLPKDLLNMMPKTGIMLVKSPKGTGKTEFLKLVKDKCDKDGKSVLLLGHRVFLLKNIADRTGLDYYREIENRGTTEAMALCLNSLPRIDPFNDTPPHTVIIDESEQVFLHLISKTLHKNHSAVFNTLQWVMSKAKRVILLDADLTTEMSWRMLNTLRSPEKVRAGEQLGVINHYTFSGRTTSMYSKDYQVIGELIESVEAGKRCYVATNSRNEAHVLGELMKTIGVSNLVITAETNETAECVDFIGNPTAESKKYQVIIASPTAQTGISIDVDENNQPQFDIIYGLFGHSVGTFQDIDQALSRVRGCNDTRVWVQNTNHKLPVKSYREFHEQAILPEEGSRLQVYGEDKVAFTKGEMLWADTYSIANECQSMWSHSKFEKFRNLREENGYVLSDVPEDEITIAIGKDAYQMAEKLLPNGYVDEIMNATIVSGEELDELRNAPTHTTAELRSIQRAAQLEFLGESFSRETVADSIKQKALAKRRDLRIGRSNLEQVKEHDRMQRKVAGTVFTNASHRTMERKLRDEMCAAMGISYEELIDRAQRVARGEDSGDIEIPNGVLMAGAQFFEAHKKDFGLCFNKPRLKNAILEPKRAWDATMGIYCLPLVAKKKGPKAARETKYFIDIGKHEILLKHFQANQVA